MKATLFYIAFIAILIPNEFPGKSLYFFLATSFLVFLKLRNKIKFNDIIFLITASVLTLILGILNNLNVNELILINYVIIILFLFDIIISRNNISLNKNIILFISFAFSIFLVLFAYKFNFEYLPMRDSGVYSKSFLSQVNVVIFLIGIYFLSFGKSPVEYLIALFTIISTAAITIFILNSRTFLITVLFSVAMSFLYLLFIKRNFKINIRLHVYRHFFIFVSFVILAVYYDLTTLFTDKVVSFYNTISLLESSNRSEFSVLSRISIFNDVFKSIDKNKSRFGNKRIPGRRQPSSSNVLYKK